MKNKRGICLYQLQDGTWHESDSLPGNNEANADYMFGRTTRSTIPQGKGFAVPQYKGANLVTPQAMGFESPLRIYRGGHVYVIDDTLKTELTNAVTTQEPTGYGAYITAYTGPTTTNIGDEIAVSGRTSDLEQGTR